MSRERELTKQIVAKLEESIVKLSKHPVIDQNDYYVRRLLTIFAEIENHYELTYAKVDAESLVGDFFLAWWENDEVAQDRILMALKARLGFEVKFNDSLIDVAKKLKN